MKRVSPGEETPLCVELPPGLDVQFVRVTIYDLGGNQVDSLTCRDRIGNLWCCVYAPDEGIWIAEYSYEDSQRNVEVLGYEELLASKRAYCDVERIEQDIGRVEQYLKTYRC